MQLISSYLCAFFAWKLTIFLVYESESHLNLSVLVLSRTIYFIEPYLLQNHIFSSKLYLSPNHYLYI